MFLSKETNKEDAMDSLPQNRGRNYTPHLYETRLHSCKRIRESGWPMRKVLSYYHVKRPSVYRWLKRYDEFGEEGLRDLSHRPKSQHPSTISKKAAYKIKCFFDQSGRNNWSSVDVWVKVSSCGFPLSYSTVLRYIKKLDGYKPYETNPKRHSKKYHTPPFPGDKWQMDVKFVPSECKSPSLPSDKSYYQYTVLDEASRKRFLWFADEHSMYESARALEAAIAFFGYAPKILQTDNGIEFTDKTFAKPGARYAKEGPCLLDSLCLSLWIGHKLIRPRTPEHNGKVERSHRIDQERFYRTLAFHSLGDLRDQGERWMKRYNSTPRMVLGLKTPDQTELAKLRELLLTTGEIRCLKLEKRLTSSDS